MKRTMVFGMLTALAALTLVWGGVAHEGGPTVDRSITDGE